MASRYHCLPGEILERATTFDLYCMDVGIRYTVVEEQKRNGTYQKSSPVLSQTTMQDMLNKVKGAK